MNGTLNGIYFTKNGVIPPEVIDNMIKTAAGAKFTGFTAHFWTDTTILDARTKSQLIERSVVIHDYNEVKPPLK